MIAADNTVVKNVAIVKTHTGFLQAILRIAMLNLIISRNIFLITTPDFLVLLVSLNHWEVNHGNVNIYVNLTL